MTIGFESYFLKTNVLVIPEAREVPPALLGALWTGL